MEKHDSKVEVESVVGEGSTFSFKLPKGEAVEWEEDFDEEEEVEYSINSMRQLRFEDLILYESSSFIVVNKPPHLSTLDDRNDPIDLISLARTYDPQLTPGHRLDKETSGILVLARGEEAYRHFAQVLEHREVKKVYHAVIEGVHDIENASIDAPIYAGATRSRH